MNILLKNEFETEAKAILDASIVSVTRLEEYKTGICSPISRNKKAFVLSEALSKDHAKDLHITFNCFQVQKPSLDALVSDLQSKFDSIKSKFSNCWVFLIINEYPKQDSVSGKVHWWLDAAAIEK